jgi:hypothetical protein
MMEISPIERVLNEVEQRTKELVGLRAKYSAAVKTGQLVSTNPLTMALNTAVDAPQENGVPSFRHFLTNEYIMRNPDKIQIIERLRIAIDDHVRAYFYRELQTVDFHAPRSGQLITHSACMVRYALQKCLRFTKALSRSSSERIFSRRSAVWPSAMGLAMEGRALH